MTSSHRCLAIGFGCVLAVLLVLTAWVGDDAYITFRTIDNLLHGHGLTWNVDERVQAFTEPLWLVVVSALVFVTGEFYVTVLALSCVLTLATFALLATRLSRGAAAVVAVGTCVCVSKTFVEYGTSGLGTPLTHLLVVLFGVRCARGVGSEREVFAAAALAGLGVLNRLDTVLFYAPVLAWLAWQRREARTLVALAAGFVPWIAWESFSIVYYGFPFPNTAYAKLATGIAGADLAWQGVQYLRNAVEMDPPTVAVIAAGLVVPVLPSQRRHLPLAIGGLLVLLYVVRVGGDLMMGRFLGVPFCVACVILAQCPWKPRLSAGVAVAAVGLSLLVLRPLLLTDRGYGDSSDGTATMRGIGDQRYWFYESTGLLSSRRSGWEPTHRWALRGRSLRAGGPTVVVHPTVGMLGFHAGPDVVVIDRNALADPLLARLPAHDRETFIIGHFERILPEGYLESRRTGENRIRDPDLAAYYEALRRVIRGPIWSGERWRAIWSLNTGALDDRRDAYVRRQGRG